MKSRSFAVFDLGKLGLTNSSVEVKLRSFAVFDLGRLGLTNSSGFCSMMVERPFFGGWESLTGDPKFSLLSPSASGLPEYVRG